MTVVLDEHGNRRHTVYTTQPLTDGVFKHWLNVHLYTDCPTLKTWARNSVHGPTPHQHEATELYNFYDDSPWGQEVKIDGASKITCICTSCVKRAWRMGDVIVGKGIR